MVCEMHPALPCQTRVRGWKQTVTTQAATQVAMQVAMQVATQVVAAVAARAVSCLGLQPPVVPVPGARW